MVVVWIIVLIAALVIEAASFALVSIWFAAGALGALIAAALGANLTVQLIVFTVLAGALLFFTRPLLKKLIPGRYIPTNSELEVGRTAVVIEEINNASGSGRVRLGGVDWAASSYGGEIIPEGECVTVTAVCSARLTVRKNEADK
ncbi:MAG: NfeD family protein [Oscillospiraceae bacterium]|nr:NfeD family protein [Oscillospiraceae bacterium]